MTYISGGSDGKALEDFRSLNLLTNTSAPVCTASASSFSKTPPRTIPTAPQTSTSSSSSSSSKTAPHTHEITPEGAIVRIEQGTAHKKSAGGVMQVEGGHAGSLGSRYCHIAMAYCDSIFIFGGCDGTKQLNDLLKFSFAPDTLNAYVPPSVHACGLKELVGSDKYSDITFVMEGKRVMAHKILCMRSPSLQNMIPIKCEDGGADEIVIADISYDTFSSLLEFLYSDACDVDASNVTDLFHAADRFGVDRLKKICECALVKSLDVSSVCKMALLGDTCNGEILRRESIAFIVTRFDRISRTAVFEEMGRENLDLLFEILRLR